MVLGTVENTPASPPTALALAFDFWSSRLPYSWLLPLPAFACAARVRCRAARPMRLMWMHTGICSSSAAAQNGSSSSEMPSLADGQHEITTPLKPRALALRKRVDGVVDAGRTDLGHADEAAAVGRAELVPEEVVVGVDAGAHEVVVLVAEEVADGALRREQDLRVDAVDVHVGEPRRAVVATRAGLLVRHAGPPELVPRQPGRRDEADRIRIGRARELPRVAAVDVLRQLRRLVLQRLRKPRLPDVGRLEDVCVGGHDAEARHAPSVA